jgi:putative hydroxymethylpyrimidine transport system substrate-binding protein
MLTASTSRRILALVLGAALLAGCGGQGGEETTEMRSEATAHSDPAVKVEETTERSPKGPHKLRELEVTLDGFEGPENVGIVMAVQRGYFAEAGLTVNATVAATPIRPVEYVVDRVVDLGVSYQPQVVLAKERREPIVAVGSLIPQPTAAMIWLAKSKISGIADLKGKTIGIPGLSFQTAFLKSVLARAGLTLRDVTVKRVRYDLVPSLASGKVDAIFGGSWNVEGTELEARGLNPVITRVQSLGFPAYDEQVLIARTDLVSKDPEAIRAFMSAVVRGTTAALKDPKAAMEAVEGSGEANPDLSRAAREAVFEETLPLLSRNAYMSPRKANDLMDWMLREGMVRRRVPVSAFLTNAYDKPQ